MPTSNLPFRLRVGVTGHRTIKVPELISRKIKEILDERVWELFDPPVTAKKSGTRLAFTILSPLAEGSDRLVAAEVIKNENSELEAVLPMAKDEYVRDFATAGSRTEFHDLLGRASRTIVLGEAAPDSTLDEVRNKAYEAVGHHVVDHCDLLIAVWDGKPARGRGGTAEIVAYARQQNRPLAIVPASGDGEIRCEKGSGISGRSLSRTAMFNEFQVPDRIFEAYLHNLNQTLFANPEGEAIEAGLKERIRERILPWYVRASLIAKKNQKLYLNTGLLVYLLSPLAVAAVATGILAPGLAFAAFACELMALSVIFAVLWLADSREVHKKWIEARFLTERLRSAVFMLACGVRPSVFAADPAVKTILGSGEWTTRLFAEIMTRSGKIETGTGSQAAAGIAFVRRHWLHDQIRFHQGKAARASLASRRLEKAGWAVFVAAIFAAAWHILSLALGHHGFLALLEKPMIFLAVALPGLGAAIGGIRGHREHSRLAKKSQFMQAALQELESRFALAQGTYELKALLRETEQLLLQETQEWLVLMKFARVEPI